MFTRPGTVYDPTLTLVPSVPKVIAGLWMLIPSISCNFIGFEWQNDMFWPIHVFHIFHTQTFATWNIWLYIYIYIYIYRTFFCVVFQVVPTEENFPCLQVVCVHTHVGLWDLSLQDMVSCIIFNQLAVRGRMQKTMPCQVYYIISYHLIVLICIYASLFLSFIICYHILYYTSNIPSDLTTRWPLTQLWWSRSVVPKKQRLYEKCPNM